MPGWPLRRFDLVQRGHPPNGKGRYATSWGSTARKKNRSGKSGMTHNSATDIQIGLQSFPALTAGLFGTRST